MAGSTVPPTNDHTPTGGSILSGAASEVSSWLDEHKLHVKKNNALTGWVAGWVMGILCFILVAIILLESPRFLVRLRASLPSLRLFRRRPRKSKEEGWSEFDRDDSLPSGGGDLFKGWRLRKGTDSVSRPSLIAPTLTPPKHVTPFFHESSYYAPLNKLLPYPFRSRAGLGELYLMASFTILMIVASAWRSDIRDASPTRLDGFDYDRTGLLCTALIPVAVALGVRGNLVGLTIGIGYERIKVFHKYVGRVAVFIATFHSILYFYKWGKEGTMAENLKTKSAIVGVIAWVAMLLMAFTSMPFFRKRWHGIFKFCHIFGIVSLLGVGFHIHTAIPYCAVTAILYGISLISSLFKTRYTSADIVALHKSDMTLVVVPGLKCGWRAGQHVRLRVPSLGFVAFLHSHPFTIASAPDTTGLVLICAKAGDWTTKLNNLAATGEPGEKGTDEDVGVWKRKVPIMLEGPYGGFGNTLPASFSSVVLFSGGSGLSYALGAAHDLIARARTGCIAARTVDLVWVVREETTAKPLIPTLSRLVDDTLMWEERMCKARAQGANAHPIAFRVHIYVTRARDGGPSIVPTRFIKEKENKDSLNPNNPFLSPMSSVSTLGNFNFSEQPLSTLVAFAGRPNPSSFVTSVADEMLGRQGRDLVGQTGMCVGVCGPGPLVDDVQTAVHNIPPWKRTAVGGVEYEAEFFGF